MGKFIKIKGKNTYVLNSKVPSVMPMVTKNINFEKKTRETVGNMVKKGKKSGFDF